MKILRWLLWPLSLLYWVVTAIRNKMYDSGFIGSTEFDVPIIAVGNLNTGGSGKTPVIEYLIRAFYGEQFMAVLSRGYKRKTYGFIEAEPEPDPKTIGDEPALYKWKYPELAVAVGEERVMAIPLIMSKYPDLDLILLDDAFQHRAVRPWIQVLVTSYLDPFWNDNLLPVGNLRESKKGYRRAKIIIITNCPKDISYEEKESLRKMIKAVDNQRIYFFTNQYSNPFLLENPSQYIDLNKTDEVLLFAGIGNPTALKEHVAQQVKTLHWMSFSDHHWYNEEDLFRIKSHFESIKSANKAILTTEKDAIRLWKHVPLLKQEGIRIYVLPMRAIPVTGQDNKFLLLVEESLEFFEQNKF